MPRTKTSLTALTLACLVAGPAMAQPVTPFTFPSPSEPMPPLSLFPPPPQPPPEGQQASRCAPRDQMLEVLEQTYGETIVASATMQERPIEVTANPESGTWTMIITNPETSLSCIIVDGQHWSAIRSTWGQQL